MDPCLTDSQRIQDVPKLPFGYMFHNDSMLQPLFDKYLFNLYQEGIFDRVLTFYQPEAPDCHEKGEFDSVNFGFVQILFYILISGIVSACFIFSIEKCFLFKNQDLLPLS